MEELKVLLLSGLGIPESPRWHEGRLWFCNRIDQQIVAVSLDGTPEVFPARDQGQLMGYSIDWLPDGRLPGRGHSRSDQARRRAPLRRPRRADLPGLAANGDLPLPQVQVAAPRGS
jgi:hypothetical protein